MALIARIPERGFVETCYGSRLQIHVDEESRSFIGMYHPAHEGVGPGLSVLEATIEEFTDIHSAKLSKKPILSRTSDDEGGDGCGKGAYHIHVDGDECKCIKISGSWRHFKGQLNFGPFQMILDEAGTAEGWWSNAPTLKDPAPKQNPWTWTTKNSDDSWFVNFVHSVGLVKFGVASAWLFFWMTLCSLWLSWSEQGETQWGIDTNTAFNTTYTIFYGFFLMCYAVQKVHPSWSYSTGVVLYTVGYCAFAILYWLLRYVPERSVDTQGDLYKVGSISFLTGSALLVYGTRTKDIFSPGGFLLWGSLLFLAGSVCFTADAYNVHIDWAQPSLVTMGNIFFLPGRFCFIYGSTTELCDMFFRTKKQTTGVARFFLIARSKSLSGKSTARWERNPTLTAGIALDVGRGFVIN